MSFEQFLKKKKPTDLSYAKIQAANEFKKEAPTIKLLNKKQNMGPSKKLSIGKKSRKKSRKKFNTKSSKKIKPLNSPYKIIY